MDIPARQENLNEMRIQINSTAKIEHLLSVVGTTGSSISWKMLKYPFKIRRIISSGAST